MRWVRVAGVLALQAAACSASRGDDLAACKAAQAQMMLDTSKAHAVIAVCDRAYQRTGATDAIAARVQALLVAGDLDGVVAAARATSGAEAPRLWHLAGDAELMRGNRAEARKWFARALEAHRASDPKRAGNSAARIAEIAEAENQLDEAIRFRYQAVTLADATGETEPRVITTLGLAEFLLAVGDTRTAKRSLATIAGQITDDSAFQQDYLRVVGEVDAFAGRASAAAASFERCTQARVADPFSQLRCRLGLVALAAHGLRPATAAETLAVIDDATTYLAPIDQAYGPDPNRRAELAWLRALVHLRAQQYELAMTALDTIDRRELGAAMSSRIDHARGVALAARGDHAGAEASFLAAAAAIERLRDNAAHRETRRSLPRELRAPYEALFVLRVRSGDLAGAVEIMERALARDFVDQLAAGIVGDRDQSLAASVEDAERRVRALRLLDSQPAHRFDATAARGLFGVGFFAAEGTLWRVVISGGTIRIAAVEAIAKLTDAQLIPEALLPAQDEPIVVVPDPVLDGVRFAALPTGKGFLVERHPVLLAPTFAMAFAPPAATSAAGPPVVLGDPDATLPSARAEAVAIAAFYEVAPVLGAAAGRDALRGARRARVLHVASHGSVHDDGTIISLADLALGPTDVLELGLAPDLAVIASCASAATHPDGMWTSMTSALLAGGTSTVVGALGSIPDGVAEAILVDFHRQAAALGPVRALAAAQRAAIRRGVPAGVWSSFAVFGHDTPRTTRRN